MHYSQQAIGSRVPDKNVEFIDKWLRKRAGIDIDKNVHPFAYFGQSNAPLNQLKNPALLPNIQEGLAAQLSDILFACGDVPKPGKDTVNALLQMVLQFVEFLIHKSLDLSVEKMREKCTQELAKLEHPHHIRVPFSDTSLYFSASNIVAALEPTHPHYGERIQHVLAKKKLVFNQLLAIPLGGEGNKAEFASERIPPALSTGDIAALREEHRKKVDMINGARRGLGPTARTAWGQSAHDNVMLGYGANIHPDALAKTMRSTLTNPNAAAAAAIAAIQQRNLPNLIMNHLRGGQQISPQDVAHLLQQAQLQQENLNKYLQIFRQAGGGAWNPAVLAAANQANQPNQQNQLPKQQ